MYHGGCGMRSVSLTRGFLLELAEVGMPAVTAALDPVVPQYLRDLVRWRAIGARTTASQTQREMASGRSAQDMDLAVAVSCDRDGA